MEKGIKAKHQSILRLKWIAFSLFCWTILMFLTYRFSDILVQSNFIKIKFWYIALNLKARLNARNIPANDCNIVTFNVFHSFGQPAPSNILQ